MNTLKMPIEYTFEQPSVESNARGRLDQKALDQFLAEVERPAFRMAEIATRNRDDALDIVQEAMIKLVEKYAHKPQAEWRPLFFTILHSRITDYHRRSGLTRRIFRWIGNDDEDESVDIAVDNSGPLDALAEQLTMETLLATLQDLPTRQQQVFMLRTWQGFSVSETASILKISEGSVKTHLFRATEALQSALSQDEDHE